MDTDTDLYHPAAQHLVLSHMKSSDKEMYSY